MDVVVLVLLGGLASVISFMMVVPPSRSLVLKMGTLLDMAERADPARYRERIAPMAPFVDGAFQHKRLTSMLKADLSAFGELCERLQREARRLDRRAHLGMVPFGLYVLGVAAWLLLLG